MIWSTSNFLLDKKQHFLGLAGMITLFVILYKHTQESKDKISKSKLGKKNPNMKRDVQGSKNPFYGKKHSIEMGEELSIQRSGSGNPMYGVEKSIHFEHYMGSFGEWTKNPSFKGTYVLDVAAMIQYESMLKSEVLTQFHIGSVKYYPYLNTGKAYKKHKYSHNSFKRKVKL